MPSLQEHCTADKKAFDKEYPEVHQLLDQFAHFPDWEFLKRHRKFLHHEEGIEYVTLRLGEEAGKSARLHVEMDCEGHVPKAIEYYTGEVDEFGCKVWRYEEIKTALERLQDPE